MCCWSLISFLKITHILQAKNVTEPGRKIDKLAIIKSLPGWEKSQWSSGRGWWENVSSLSNWILGLELCINIQEIFNLQKKIIWMSISCEQWAFGSFIGFFFVHQIFPEYLCIARGQESNSKGSIHSPTKLFHYSTELFLSPERKAFYNGYRFSVAVLRNFCIGRTRHVLLLLWLFCYEL